MPTMTQYFTVEFPKPISINLNGTRHSFSNYAKYQEWYEKQLEFYQKIGNPGNAQYTLQAHIINQVENTFNSNRPDDYKFKNLSDEFKSFIESTFNQYGLLDYASVEGKWLTKQLKTNPSIVPSAAQYFVTKI